MRSSILQAIRLLVITHVLATHGMAALAMRMRLFAPYAWFLRLFKGEEHPENLGSQIRRVLEHLGPTFIKFGQMLSTRVDLLPMNIAVELKKLQDAVPPEDYKTIQSVIEKALKKPLLADPKTGQAGIFRSFNKQPVAAASIAQVHFAELDDEDGTLVAIKVRRPSIHRTIAADLALLELLAQLFDRYFPEYERFKAQMVVKEFSSSIRGELNLRAEGAHASRFNDNLAEVKGVCVPKVVWGYTTEHTLVMERIAGTSFDERDALLAEGHDTLKLCERMATAFFHMVFIDGYFHADLHPGNIFVDKQGTILLVDFGIVGHMDIRTRRFLAQMLLAFLQRDYTKAAQVHADAGYIGRHVSISEFEDALREIAEPIFGHPLQDISLGELLFSLFSVTERFQMQTRRELLMLQKTIVVVEGVVRELHPDINMWMLAKPLVSKWMLKNMGPTAQLQYHGNEAKQIMQSWLSIPEKLDEVTTYLRPKKKRLPLYSPIVWRPFVATLFLAIGSVLTHAAWILDYMPLIAGSGGLFLLLLGLGMLIRR
ncbi:MAG: 2-polyprenylphenol 6-hydroxylase [Mariprofundales bacterium]